MDIELLTKQLASSTGGSTCDLKITAGLGVIHDQFVLGDYDRALVLAESLEQAFPGVSAVCFASGAILMATEKRNDAWIKMINAASFAKREGNQLILAHTFLIRAEIFVSLGHFKSASRWAERAFEAYGSLPETGIYTARANAIITAQEAC